MKIHAQRYFGPELLTVLICLAGMAGFLARAPLEALTRR
jgi:hypothetical protein